MNAAQALNRLAEQTGSIMLFSYDLVSTRQANAVSGRYPLQAALDLLLKDTGLSGGLTDERVVSISRSESARRPEEDAMPKHKRSFARRLAAFLVSIASGAGASAQDVQPTSLEEVVVSAQKREERLTDVPISMSVMGGVQLDAATGQGMTEILNTVPGVATSVATQGGGTLVSVRGVAAGFHLFTGSSPIGYYLDSVPFGFVRSALVPDVNAYDMDHVEVLRGPQGTLYGASAMNGVVRVLTSNADPDKFEFKVRSALSYTEEGSENYRGDMSFNLPIIEGKLAARAVVGYQSLSGWIDKPIEKDANDATIRNARFKINARPSDELSIDAFFWTARSKFGAPSMSIDGKRRVTSFLDEPIESDYDVSSVKIGYDFPGVTLTSMTGYIDYSDDSDFDIADFVGRPGSNTILQTINHSKALSQEFVLNSTHAGPWRWTLGGIYRDVEDRTWQYFPPLVSPIDHTDYSESFALFGEVTRSFLDGRLELTAGLRHFEDETRYEEHSRSNGAAQNLLLDVESKFDATTPRVVLAWHPRELTTVYASYSEGFRSGAPQTATVLLAAPQTPSMKPDLLKNYEVGSKGSLWGGRLQFDTAVFFLDWRDIQQTISVPVAGGTTAPALINIESASGIGFEFGVSAEVMNGLILGTTFSWNDLSIDEPVPGAFEKGDRANFSPEYTAGASAEYTFALGSGGYDGHFSLGANYTSSQIRRALVGNVTRVFTGDNMLIGRTSFAVDSPGHWRATLFVDNINNEDGSVFRWHFPPDFAYRIRPRTVGLQLDYRY